MVAKSGVPSGPVHTEALVIGAGFAGLEMAKALKDAGWDHLVLEKGSGIGGTWFWNRYPGLACDISSYLYGIKDDRLSNPVRLYDHGPTILANLCRYANEHGLMDNIVLNTKVVRAEWNDNTSRWHVYTEGGVEYVCQFLIPAAGALHIPSIPDVPGREEFEGPAFHTAEWDPTVDLSGKKVAVIGTGASAIQAIPEIFPIVGELKVLQRTPPWVAPLGNPAIPKAFRAVVKRSPWLRKQLRSGVYEFQEFLGYAMNEQQALLKVIELLCKWNIWHSVRDKETRRKLTPDFPAGCKRLLKHTGYYRVFRSRKTELITDTIARILPNGIVTVDKETGKETLHEVDVIIWATGFHVTDSYKFVTILGPGGEDLGKRWDKEGMIALRGTTVAGMKNLFFLLGPNTGLGNNSVVMMIEAQIGLVMQLISWVKMSGAQAFAPTREAQDAFNETLQARLAGTVQNSGGCRSWYLIEKQGEKFNPVLWGGSIKSFEDAVHEVDPAEYKLYD